MTTTERERGRYRRPRRTRRRPVWPLLLPALAAGGVFWLRWQCWGLAATHTVAALPGLPSGFDGITVKA